LYETAPNVMPEKGPTVTAAPATGITGIHHLTALSGNAQRTVDFYTRLLGLRLVRQTVNPDDPSSYRLYFAGDDSDKSLLVFEERKVPRGRFGIGGTHHLAFETANRDTLLQWKRWLTDAGIPVTGPYNRVYFESIYFTDPDGLILEIATHGPGWTVDEAPDALGSQVKLPPQETTAHFRDEAAIAATTWPEPIPIPTPEMRLRRMHHITAIGSDAGQLQQFFSAMLGLRLVKRTVNFDDPSSPHLYWGVGAGAPGTIITYFAYPHGTMRPVRLGTGMTHHFALSVPDQDALSQWREFLQSSGVPVHKRLDEEIFPSIEVQDPDGQIIEIVAQSPGLAGEGPPAALGRKLHLPPSLASRRAEIEAHLTPLTVPEQVGY
jgi:glyoxalase family protein